MFPGSKSEERETATSERSSVSLDVCLIKSSIQVMC